MLVNEQISNQIKQAFDKKPNHTAADRNDYSWLYTIISDIAKRYDTKIRLLYKQGHNVPLYPIPNRGIVSVEYVTVPKPVMIQLSISKDDFESLTKKTKDSFKIKKVNKEIHYDDKGHRLDTIAYNFKNIGFYGSEKEIYLETIHNI